MSSSLDATASIIEPVYARPIAGSRDWFECPSWDRVYAQTGLTPAMLPGVRTMAGHPADQLVARERHTAVHLKQAGASAVAPFPYRVHRSHLPVIGLLAPPDLLGLDEGGLDTLWTHQRVGVEFIRARRGTLLADEQRVGKTATTIHAHDPANGPLVVISPVAGRAVWHEWAARRFGACQDVFEAEDCSICARVGADKRIADVPSFLALEGRKPDVDLLRRGARVLHLTYAAVGPWSDCFAAFGQIGTLVCDEAHLAGVQNRRNPTVVAIKRLNTCAEKAVFASGTPMWNMPSGLFPIIDTICPTAFGPFWSYATRYCLPGTSLVWMADLSFRPIRDVKVGDYVWGWEETKTEKQHVGDNRRRFKKVRVLETFTRQAELVRGTMKSGRTVVCTPDHRWASAKHHASEHPNWRYQALELGDTRFQDAHGKITGRPRASSVLAHVITPAAVHRTETAAYRRGYLHGFCDGDGAISFGWYLRPNKPCPSAAFVRRVEIRITDEDAITRLYRFGKRLNLSPTKGSDQKPINGRKQAHRVTFSTKKGLKFFYSRREGRREYWRGWLAGVYDAEGWGLTFAQYREVNPATYDNICDALKMFDFAYSQDHETVRVLGGKHAFVRLWNLLQPAIKRKADAIHKTGFKANWIPDPLIKLEPAGRGTVYCLKTETGNFVADGFGTKNCDAKPGAHGWSSNGKSNERELEQRLSAIMLRRTWNEIRPNLPPIQRSIEYVDLTQEMHDAIFVEANELRRAAGLGKAQTVVGNLERLRKLYAKPKIKRAVALIHASLNAGHSVVAWTYHKDAAHMLLDALRTPGFESVVYGPIHGDILPIKRRETILEQCWAERRPHVLVATMGALATSVSLAWAPHEIFVELDWTPAVISQSEMRIFDGKQSVSSVMLVADCDTDRRQADALIVKLEAMRGLRLEAGVGDVADVLSQAFRIEAGRSLDAVAELIVAGEQL